MVSLACLARLLLENMVDATDIGDRRRGRDGRLGWEDVVIHENVLGSEQRRPLE